MALSDVTARRVFDGDIAREKIAAGSTPRRSSAMRAQFVVEKRRINVPVSLAVARISPLGESVMAFKGVP